LTVHPQFIWEGAAIAVQTTQGRTARIGEDLMLKTIAAIGVSAGLVLAPLAALAQTDQTAPAAPAAPAASDQGATPEKAPMKSKHHMSHKKHMAKGKKKMEKPMESAPAAPAEAPKS
jgi:hypothetical protein